MKIGHLVALSVVYLISGCAHQQEQQVANEQLAAEARYRAQIHTELGASYLGRAQLGVALDELTIAVQADPKYAPAYNMLGLVHMELRDDALAEQNFKRSLALDAANPDAHHNYGWFLCQRGRYNEAITHFLAAVRDPLYATPEKTYLNAGICSLRNKDLVGAEDFFGKTLKIQPQNAQALYQLSALAYAKGNYAEAKSYIEKHLQGAQPNAEALWLATRIARKLSDRNAEANYGFQLRKNFPDSPQAIELRAGRYE